MVCTHIDAHTHTFYTTVETSKMYSSISHIMLCAQLWCPYDVGVLITLAKVATLELLASFTEVKLMELLKLLSIVYTNMKFYG